MKPTWERGNVRLYLGDCREVLPHVGKVDACVTDPPYGIDYGKAGGFNEANGWGKWRDSCPWDKDRPDRSAFDAIRAASNHQIIWGGNYFADMLPPSMHWLIWDKGQRDFSLADFEMAWGSQKRAARIFDYPRSRALKDGKEHPTQKPLDLMVWCLGELPSGCSTVLDPYMGVGTTGVAAVQTGRAFVGIEIDPTYFEISVRRIDKAIDAGALFAPVPPAVREVGLFDAAGETK